MLITYVPVVSQKENGNSSKLHDCMFFANLLLIYDRKYLHTIYRNRSKKEFEKSKGEINQVSNTSILRLFRIEPVLKSVLTLHLLGYRCLMHNNY